VSVQDNTAQQEKLIRSLADQLGQAGHPARIFETHISWIIVTESLAYKFKKAVRFDFLDFSTLDARLFYCREELRLNWRTAPGLYLDVVPVTGDTQHPLMDGTGEPIEYAVRMRVFPQSALWSERIGNQCITRDEVDALARQLAQFHQAAAVAAEESSWGGVDILEQTAEDNIGEIAGLVRDADGKEVVGELHTWQIAQHRQLKHVFSGRKASGFVRECHGDLHGGNILTVDGRVMMFDCIEFNEGLRWIDVINDFAFIYMDLQCHSLCALAARLRNQYLEVTGDYEGTVLLPYYEVQRALVRCKVALLHAAQVAGRERDLHEQQARQYLSFALRASQPGKPALIVMHGYAGSGKSTVAGYLVELLGAIQIRSDVERKRLHGFAAESRTAAPLMTGLYGPQESEATYQRLRSLAGTMVQSGSVVVVDAAFLHKPQRDLFAALALELDVPFFIVDILASDATLQSRVAQRVQQGTDASDAGLDVLAYQLSHRESLRDDEIRYVVPVDGDAGLDIEVVRQACTPVMAALGK